MDTQKLTHLSLFSGIGGLDIAAEWAGFQTVGQCEWADCPTQILERHWPDLPRWRDIRTLTGESFYERTGLRTIDLVSGGFPCQPFSLAGARRGTADDRYLWPELLRVVSELRPTWVIGENVAGLLSMVQSSEKIGVEGRSINRFEGEDHYEAVWARQENMLLVALIQDLERIGYEVQAFVIPACAVGARHRRDRIAIVAHCNSIGLEGAWPEQQATGIAGGCENVAHANGSGHIHRQDEVLPADAGKYAQCQPIRCGANVAHTQRIGSKPSDDYPHPDEERNCQTQKQAGWAEPSTARPSGGTVPDPTSVLPQGQYIRQGKREFGRSSWGPAQSGMGRVANGFPHRLDGFWEIEPDIPRIASGVPNRVPRLIGLGNAVVPPQFYPICAAIAKIEQEG